MPLIRSFLILLYSLAVTAVAPLLGLLAPLLPRLRAQTAGRPAVPALAREMAAARQGRRCCVAFFCSSAGEYEQAQPLIERLVAAGDVFVQVIFFSRSGLDFARARGEAPGASASQPGAGRWGGAVGYCLSPVTDSVWHWGWVFAALRPDVVAVVRHELWPGFLEAARHYGRLVLVDASRSLGETRSVAKRFARKQLLELFHRVYAVAETDAAFFRDRYALPVDRLVAVGETKYDRVIERAKARAGDVAALRRRLDAAADPAARRLILGSAYRQEVELVLAARAGLAAGAPGAWQLVIAPHHVNDEMVQWIEERCRTAGLAVARYTTLAAGAKADAIVLDTMGMLAEAYGTGHAALVGGALHHQVHNVLEPACRGLALAWGPFYKNSQEAAHLVDAGLATVVTDAQAVAEWWRRLDTEGDALASKVVTAVQDLAGASDRILRDWQPMLGAR